MNSDTNMRPVSGRIHALLVEDDSGDALLLEHMLTAPGRSSIELHIVNNLSTGIEYALRDSPDVILLDLSLPDAKGLDGFSCFQEVAPNIPIVIVTGLDSEESAIGALQAGAQDYLVKGSFDETLARRAIQHAIERQRLQRELIDAQRREQRLRFDKLESLGILAGGIAHDFNNLLMGIMGNVSLARTSPPETCARLLEEAERATWRATSLTRQLLTFAKGGTPVKKVDDVTGVLRDAVEFALRGSHTAVRFNIEDALPAAEFDNGQIAQVFQNLAINADQAMPRGGILTVSVSSFDTDTCRTTELSPGAYIQIDFADNGIGIAPDDLPHIFDPYFSTKQKGSGLGLATSYAILQKHGGGITVDSTSASGSVFHVFLPVSETVTPKTSPKTPTEVTADLKGRALVMDDDPVLRDLLEAFLHRVGFDVTCAADGQEALDLYKQTWKPKTNTRFDIVIADLTVPGGMGGEELLKALKKIDPDVRAIASSGYAEGTVMSHFEDYGFVGVIPKPYSLEMLRRTIASCMENS